MNKSEILQYTRKKFQKRNPEKFRIGDTVRVHVKIKEGNNVRVQVFEGTVIAMKGCGLEETFTVRKISFGVGVERIYPLVSPSIEKVQVMRSGHVRRAKLYYLRGRVGKASRLEEKESLETEAVKDVSVPASPASATELVAAEDKT